MYLPGGCRDGTCKPCDCGLAAVQDVSYSDGCRRDGSSDQRVIGIACGSILFSESIRWIFPKRTL